MSRAGHAMAAWRSTGGSMPRATVARYCATVARYCATCCRAWHGLAALVAGLRAAVCRTLHACGGRRPACSRHRYDG
ncbi:hypothetical protein F511_33125 [Dorcoceras hygrometricum]|uniref:Uncharacterized protein n=1 Tax=Dorcoceras hygrometricum TaxID=472368 RepID=A0A2Z7CXY7_9LAMI|nr:hypothetical protein F511_33125 [Dorcoceras hygrometricum]